MSHTAVSGDKSGRAAALLIPEWPVPAAVRAIVTTRGLPGFSTPPYEACNLGAHCGDRSADVAANRSALVGWLGLPATPLWLRQVHGSEVLDLDLRLEPGTDLPEPLADASYTKQPGRVCVIQTADCLPVLICSGDGREVAAVHAGWRGLAAGVIEASVARFSAPPLQLHAWLGPAIGAASYEVGDEVRDAFLRHNASAADAFAATRPQHWLCDLYCLAHLRLAALGVVSVHGGGFDTLLDERFYSHRRGRPTGRFASLIWIQSDVEVSRRKKMASQSAAASAVDVQPHDGDQPRALFPFLLGAAFDHLPPSVRRLHLAQGSRTYNGQARVERGRKLLSRLCAWATRLPPASGDAPIEVTIETTRESEVWTRCFGRHQMRSRLVRGAGLLRERLGLVDFGFALSVQDAVLHWRVSEVRVLGIPLSARWFDAVWARESEREGRYHFEVSATLPLIGMLVRYAGSLSTD